VSFVKKSKLIAILIIFIQLASGVLGI